MKIASKTVVLLLIALVAVSVVGCSKTKGGTAASGQPIEIRFGNITYPEVVLAQEKGFFAEELKSYNATVKVHTFQSGPPQVEALAAKELDFAAFGDQPAIQAIASGVPVKIIAGISDGTENLGLLARADSGIKKVADIKGKKIAAPAGTTAHQLLMVMLEKHNYTFDDIEYVNLAIGSITPSLIAGNVEGAVAFGRVYADPPLDEGLVKVNSGKGYKRNVNVIAARAEFLENNPGLSAAVLRAIQKAAKWRVDHYDETLTIVSNFVGTDKEIFIALFPTMVTLLKLDDAAKEDVILSADILFKNDLIAKRLTAADLFDEKYAASAGIETYPGWGADTINK